MKKITTLLLLTILSLTALPQVNPNGYNIFYHDNGQKSSEGTLRDGKPDKYWKSYNEKGILVSEGNRKDYLLDSIWNFYDNNGELKLEVNYLEGKKNGIRKTYRENEIIIENFENDIKQGISSYYYLDGKIRKSIFYSNGLEEGVSHIYDTTGNIIEIVTYKKGFITSRERINRYDNKNLKHGKWKVFFREGPLQIEGTYKHGLKHGYFKEYDLDGSLVDAAKYINGEKQMNVVELVALDMKTEYYPSGKIKVKATYKDDKPEGVWREYNEEGEIERSFIYKYGIVIGEGIITEKGQKDGSWIEYFGDGKLKAKGEYKNDVKIGPWKYFHRNGKPEQNGTYTDKGLPIGEWRWYYPSGILLREETFIGGLADGVMTEYNDLGEIITKGDFINGREEGFWFYKMGDHREEGDYSEGLQHGNWKYFYRDGTPSFVGRFIEGNPHGKHTWFWNNGNKKDEGNYVMGRKHGQWTSYNYEGIPFIVITYENGIEKKYDGIKINPEFTEEDFE